VRTVLLVTAVAFMGFCCSSTWSYTWAYVPSPAYQTIQDVLSDPQFQPGDIIHVVADAGRWPDGYPGGISISDPVTVVGWDDVNQTEAPVGAVVVNGAIDTGGAPTQERCLEVSGVIGDPVIIRSLTLRNGYAITYGGGIACAGSDLRVEACVVGNCQAGYGGGGVYIESSSVVELTGCTLTLSDCLA